MPLFRRTNPVAADEGERPFWISYADMMTACMTLFLVIMAAFLAINAKALRDSASTSKLEKARSNAIRNVMARIDNRIQQMPESRADEVVVEVGNQSIAMGKVCQFEQSQYRLNAAQQQKLRRYVQTAILAEFASSAEDWKWIKSIDVVGFASREGTYLTNLGISQARSAFLVCSLLELPAGDRLEEKRKFRNMVRTKFQVAAFSENNLLGGGKSTSQTERNRQNFLSRRAEIRIVFYSVEEMREREAKGTNPTDLSVASGGDDDGLGACTDVWKVVK
jgi:outer membrane protein OmpA-like peptidoglycan-associated protein